MLLTLTYNLLLFIKQIQEDTESEGIKHSLR